MKYSNKKDAESWTAFVVACLSILLFGMATWIVFRYRNTPLQGFYAFRETQTALTSYWVCKEGFQLAYLTPVGGYPWSIPFEFPIYQWLVALVGCTSFSSLDPVGRLVSFAFWVACLWPAWIICRRLFADRAALYFWLFAALFLSSPVYLHYGHAFLPESVALFFTLCFLAFSLEMSFGPDRWKQAILCSLFLILAILQKATTVLPLLLFALVFLWARRQQLMRYRLGSAAIWKLVVAYMIPVAVGLAWVRYSDHVKLANSFGTLLTSSALTGWNFGPLSARYSQTLWVDVIWRRDVVGSLAGHFGMIPILVGFAYAPKRRLHIAVGVALFITFYMVFENVLFVHAYYPVSNTIYLIFALAVAIGGLIEAKPRYAFVWVLAYASVVAINLNTYLAGPLYAEEARHFDETSPVLATAKYIREHTSPDEPILVYGDLWNSELPYYGQRKAFVVPSFFPAYLAPLDTPEKYLNGVPGAVLICGDARTDKDIANKVVVNYGAWPKASLVMCDIYLRKG